MACDFMIVRSKFVGKKDDEGGDNLDPLLI